MKTHVLQSSFNNGVLDDRMAARLDIKQYYQGVLQGENVQFLPQGGVRRRPGFRFIDKIDLPDGSPNNGKVVPFVFNTDQAYVLVFVQNLIAIYRNDVLVDTVTTTYTQAQIDELDFAQTADTMIIVHEDVRPKLLVRGANDSDFTLSNVSFDFIPQYDFNDADSPTPVSCIQTARLTGIDEGARFKLTLEGVDTDAIGYSGANASTREEIRIALQDLDATGNSGISVTSSGVTLDATFTITFADESADNWRVMSGRFVDGFETGDERVRTARTQIGTSRKENVWSSTRGWPRTVVFFEGRLWFGGSKSRPHTIWGSKVNDFFNFDPGKSRANQAIDITLDTDQINRIQSIVGGRDLSVFTIGGEYIFKKAVSDPITPDNVAIIQQTSYGSKRIKPVSIGGAQLFIQRTGKAIREFLFDTNVESYDSSSVTLLSPNIIDDPIDMSLQRGSTADDAAYVYLTNSDGSLAVYNTARSENVAAWAKWTSPSCSFKSCAVVLDEVYVLTLRANSGPITDTFPGVEFTFNLEKLDPLILLDAAVLSTSNGAPYTGLNHLDGNANVYIVGGNTDDGWNARGGYLVANNTITEEFVYAGQIGVNFEATIETMPIVQNQGSGFDFDDEKRISRVTLEVYESSGLEINGFSIPEDQNEENRYAYGSYTGRRGMILTGWSKRPTVTITQSNPLPMTLLGIEMEVNG